MMTLQWRSMVISSKNDNFTWHWWGCNKVFVWDEQKREMVPPRASGKKSANACRLHISRKLLTRLQNWVTWPQNWVTWPQNRVTWHKKIGLKIGFLGLQLGFNLSSKLGYLALNLGFLVSKLGFNLASASPLLIICSGAAFHFSLPLWTSLLWKLYECGDFREWKLEWTLRIWELWCDFWGKISWNMAALLHGTAWPRIWTDV